MQDARVHYADLKQQTHQAQPHTTQVRGPAKEAQKTQLPDPSGPNSVPTPPPAATAPGSTPTSRSWTGSTEARPPTRGDPSSTIPLVNTTNATQTLRDRTASWMCGACAP